MRKRVIIYSIKPPHYSFPYIRLWAPLSLAEGLELVAGCEFDGEGIFCNFSLTSSADLIVIQRDFPLFLDACSNVLKIAAANHIPVVYETDVDLVGNADSNHLPPTQAAVRQLIEQILRMVAAVTVPNETIAANFRKFNNSVIVIPNVIDDKLWANLPLERHTDKTIIGYVGSPNHKDELDKLIPALQEILVKYTETVELWVWGLCQPKLRSISGVRHVAGVIPNYPAFARQFIPMRPDIAIIPQNGAESGGVETQLRYYEYSMLRIPGVYANSGSYASEIENGKTGLLVDNTADAWLTAMESLIENPVLRERMGGMARIDVTRKYALTRSEGGMGEVVLDLINRSTGANSQQIKPLALPVRFELNYDVDKFEHCRQLRFSGQYEEAAKGIVELLDQYPSDKALLTESLRLLINIGDSDKALATYIILNGLYGANNLNIEPEALYRLELARQNSNIIVSLDIDSAWINEHKNSGIDTIRKASICDCEVSTPAIILYNFRYICHSCGRQSGVRVQTNLLIHKEVLCPFCFARNLITYASICKYIRQSKKQYLPPDIGESNRQLNAIRQKVNKFQSSVGVPILAQYINQDFIFWIASKLINSRSGDVGGDS